MSVSASPHSNLMDAVYRHQRHIYDATRKFYLLGRDQLIAELSAAPGALVLEIGCGTGRNLILAARHYPKAQFYGVDISEAMLATARANVAREGLGERITLAQGDATDFDPMMLFGVAAFERVFVSYALSMIPGWTAAISAALSAVNDGGRLHVVDFGQQERLPPAARGILQAWLRQFHVTPRRELADVLSAASVAAEAELRVRPLFRGYAWLFTVQRQPRRDCLST